MNTAAFALQSRFAAALLDPEADMPPRLCGCNGSDARRRFDVYRNNVVHSLVSALADTFPVVQALVGTTFFRAMAAVFVRQSPPSSPLLARYGEGFPAFLAQFAPARGLAYLADVARLELARLQSLHAADATVLEVPQGAAAWAGQEHVEALRFTLHPSVRLLAFQHAAVSIWAAHHGHGALESVDTAQPEAALVVRVEDEVEVVPCAMATLTFARSLRQGRGLADCAAEAACSAGEFDLAASLRLLLHHGALSAIHLPEERRA